jgi:hypothetical protein
MPTKKTTKMNKLEKVRFPRTHGRKSAAKAWNAEKKTACSTR